MAGRGSCRGLARSFRTTASTSRASIRDRLRPLELVPGVGLVMDETDLAGKLGRADLVLTGEGRIDEQTAFGKTALGVAMRALEAGLPCIAVGGGVTPEGIEALDALAV